MTKQEIESIVKYLTNDEINLAREKFNFDKRQCHKMDFDDYFETTFNCRHYEDVISGEGNEKDKIDTVYSSSLQSFVIFDHVSVNNKIKLRFDKVVEFDEVIFEYQNPVIGYPSSMDVVLLNRSNKEICFIESKLCEVIRDSSDEGKKVIGISYFRSNDVGYANTLKLSLSELDLLGIEHPKEYLAKYRGLSKEEGGGDKVVNKIPGNTYVYSEGIKQVLSHLIGICNFKDSGQKYLYENTFDPIGNHNGYHIYYLELFNAMPELCRRNKVFADKISNFKKHVEEVFRVLNKKGLGINLYIKSYQDLFNDDAEEPNGYFSKLSKKIINFYKLNEK